MGKRITLDDNCIIKTPQGLPLKTKNRSQEDIVNCVLENTVSFILGPAGTGKTAISVFLALSALNQRAVKKIIITRPIVEAGESLGFLPGDIQEKVDPYMRPIYDCMDLAIGIEKRKALIEKNVIEIMPLAYARGRTLENAFIILDEAQNCTYKQLKLFLTRIGLKSICIINGDPNQCDLPYWQDKCLVTAEDVLAETPDVGFVHTSPKDVVRHRVVSDMIASYMIFEAEQEAMMDLQKIHTNGKATAN